MLPVLGFLVPGKELQGDTLPLSLVFWAHCLDILPTLPSPGPWNMVWDEA